MLITLLHQSSELLKVKGVSLMRNMRLLNQKMLRLTMREQKAIKMMIRRVIAITITKRINLLLANSA